MQRAITALALASALLATACAGNPTPAPRAGGGSAGGTPTAAAPRASGGTTYAPSTAPRGTSGRFVWYPSLREAQQAARSSGRLVFLESGRDDCGNCQALKNRIIPGEDVNAELADVSVGYYDDCDRDPYSTSFKLLQAHLPGAAVLPLVGWVTADLAWVHGFSGGRNAPRFRDEIATARALLRRSSASAEGSATVPSYVVASAPPPAFPDPELADVGGDVLGEGEVDLTAPAVAAAIEPAETDAVPAGAPEPAASAPPASPAGGAEPIPPTGPEPIPATPMAPESTVPVPSAPPVIASAVPPMPMPPPIDEPAGEPAMPPAAPVESVAGRGELPPSEVDLAPPPPAVPAAPPALATEPPSAPAPTTDDATVLHAWAQ